MISDPESPEALAWAELQRRGTLRPRYLQGLEEEIAAELARCFDPFIFEQAIRPYGAIVAREMPHLARLGRIVDTTGLTPDVVRSLADGQSTFVLVVKDEPLQLLLTDERIDTEQDYASHAAWVDGLIICNNAEGTVRIVTVSSVTVVQGRRWIAKDLVFEAAEDIMEVVPASDSEVVRRLLEVTHHRLSPHRIGATLLYLLEETPRLTKRRDDGIPLEMLGVSVLNEAEESVLLHQVRYRDGAVLIARGGRLLASNVILRPTKASEQAVPPIGGTRHTSAARHTYDCPDVLAFVVSIDGPVTVFSDGLRIAQLKTTTPLVRPKTFERIAELCALRRAERGKGSRSDV
jgi:DNA integrity scanning protein DisA with diadenylate cyclase activity